jgi:glycosyltransferase involved in cell wall biosynthesis
MGLGSQSLIFGSNPLEMKTDWNVGYKSNFERLVKALWLLKKIDNSFDVYHFNFCKTLLDFPSRNLDFIDINLYKGAKFATFNGSDIRRSQDVNINPFTPFPRSDAYNKEDRQKEDRLNKFLKKIDFSFVLNPDLMNYIPQNKGMFLPYIKESWFDSPGIKVKRNNKKFTIVHAPTNRRIKGTEEIIRAVSKLKNQFEIDFILVEGLSHEQAKKVYSRADLMIDQLRIGWYGGVAVEAMRMGVPVAVYINQNDLLHVPEDMRSAIENAFLLINENNLFDQLAMIIDSTDRYKELLANSIDYVNYFHDPNKIVRLVIEKYRHYS